VVNRPFITTLALPATLDFPDTANILINNDDEEHIHEPEPEPEPSHNRHPIITEF
jgi:hypothetical protein